MKLRILAIFFASIFSSSIAHAEFSDYRVSAIRSESRDGLPKIFEKQYQNSSFLEELVGIRKYDKLATNLPTGLTGKDIVRLIAPNEDLSLAISVGVKPFPYKLNSYVAVVCFARDKNEYKRLKGYFGCEKKTYQGDSPTQDRNDIFYLGLIEYEPTNAKSKLITKPIKIEPDWNFVSPRQFRSASDRNSNLLPTGVYKYFDFAPFKVSATQTAFGMRVWRTESYSGGSGYFEVLALFMVDNDKILNIFAEPMYFYMNMKGDLNKDHTPSPRRLYEGENVLVVLPSQTDGYYDLQIKSLDNDWQKSVTWDASLKRYLPSDRTATLNRIIAETLNLRIEGVTYF
jgi:hypothetical protein